MLDNNAVGYVALPSAQVGAYPEYDLVRSGRARFLQRIWSDAHWRLFRVVDPSPIAAPPAKVVAFTQSAMTVRIPCVCKISVRVRWSKFLDATKMPTVPTVAASSTAPTASAVSTSRQAPSVSAPSVPAPSVKAAVRDDGSGWTTLTTTAPGSYLLTGSISGIVR